MYEINNSQSREWINQQPSFQVSQSNHHSLKEYNFFYWSDDYQFGNDKYIVCIWKVKRKGVVNG